jgi:hypothetical protein
MANSARAPRAGLKDTLPDEDLQRLFMEVAQARGDLPPSAPPAPKPDPYAEALQRGEREEGLNRLGSDADNLARAIAGLPAGEKRASVRGQYVGDLEQKAQLDALGRKGTPGAGKPQKSTDPNSPESTRAQARIRSIIPTITDEELSQIPEADEDDYLKYRSMTEGRGIQRDAEKGRNERFTEQQLQQAQQFAAREGREWAEMGQRERLAYLREARAASTQGAQDVTNLRKEFMGNTVVKDYLGASIGYDKVRRAAAEPSAANDLALIFGYMKTLDPGSTVREGEFANAQNAGGVDDKLVNLYNRVRSGERLNPEQRAQFVKSAESQFAAYREAYESMATQYEGLAPEGAAKRVVLPNMAPTQTAPRRTSASTTLPNGGGRPTQGAPSGKVRVHHTASGRMKDLDPATAEKVLATPGYERVQ